MNSPKKGRKRGQRIITLTESEYRKLERDTSYRMFVLFTGYLMDELDYDSEKIGALWDGIQRYISAIDDEKVITLDNVREIIEQHTGMKMVEWVDDKIRMFL